MTIINCHRGFFGWDGCSANHIEAKSKHTIFLDLRSQGCYAMQISLDITESGSTQGPQYSLPNIGRATDCTPPSSGNSSNQFHWQICQKRGFASAQEKPRAGESQKRNSLGCNGGGLVSSLPLLRSSYLSGFTPCVVSHTTT